MGFILEKINNMKQEKAVGDILYNNGIYGDNLNYVKNITGSVLGNIYFISGVTEYMINSATTSPTVISPQLVSISISFNPTGGTSKATYYRSTTINCTATGTYDDTSTANITTGVTWQANNSNVTTYPGGVVITSSPGPVNIIAKSGTIIGTKSMCVIRMPGDFL